MTHLMALSLFSRYVWSGLIGTRFGEVLGLLRRNRQHIEARYFLRAMFMLSSSLVPSIISAYEDRRYGRLVEKALVEPPIFILGHWRSGTTFLQQLMALDPRFAHPNLYQATLPHGFLSTEATLAPLVARLIPKKRIFDNVLLHPQVPWEDETALCSATTLSPMIASVFHEKEEEYRKYLTLEGISREELDLWKSEFLLFLRKLSWKYERPLILKSPAHTGRIRFLLTLFPEARFVHIHRNPYAVFQSSLHMMQSFGQIVQLQRVLPTRLSRSILLNYQVMYDAFFRDVGLIPSGRFSEVRFEDLENDPIAHLRTIYSDLGLDGFSTVTQRLKEYLNSVAGYKKNRFGPLAQPWRGQVAQSWGRCFQAWNYKI